MGNKYIVSVSCLFSKWPEATALPDKSAIDVAELICKCFTRHVCCKVKISDQGRLMRVFIGNLSHGCKLKLSEYYDL